MRNSPSSSRSSASRLAELDALRGIAAMMVVLFHYTTRFDELFGHVQPPAFSVPWGHYGVNLFFMISGFVIFMTLERTHQPMDFLVSRFSRLYPAYWAAVMLTFGAVHALGLPGKEVTLPEALVNLSMVHRFFHVPHVDGVYWTLEVELLFYAWAFAAYRLGWLNRVHILLLAALALRLVYHLADRVLGIDLPWTLTRLLILDYIGWFTCGIMIYRLSRPGTAHVATVRWDILVLATAIAMLCVVESPGIGLLTACLSVVLYGAATARMPWLRGKLFVYLGTISYTLYLVHENIGWAIMRHLERAGWSSNVTIASAVILSLVLASALTWLIEKPAMASIRKAYQQRQSSRAQPAPLR